MEIRPLTHDDWGRVRDIYAAGIASGNSTFETETPTWQEFDASKLPGHRWVAVSAGEVVGWIAASAVSDRCVYAGVVEHSVYVDPAHQGAGIGRALLDAFITGAEAADIWTIQSGIFPENTASIALHHATGFRTVGTRERVGRMTYGPAAGQWRDVILLERRSRLTGT